MLLGTMHNLKGIGATIATESMNEMEIVAMKLQNEIINIKKKQTEEVSRSFCRIVALHNIVRFVSIF